MHSATLFGLLAAAVSVSARACSGAGEIKCPIVFDGRVKTTTQLTDFDSYATSQFNPDYVKGNDLKWSVIIKFPSTRANARFDGATHKPFEVTLNDQSVFQTQYGFRRAGLLFNGDTNEGSPGSAGVKTIHFSLKWDAQRALNLSHEYLLVWHEAGDYSANQFNFEAGAILGQPSLPEDTYKLLDRNNKQIWSTKILKNHWQNFAVTLDFNQNTLQVHYSKGDKPLKTVTGPVPNNNAGDGQYQMGMLKKPTGTDDVVNSGYQSSNLDEGLIYGSLFVEDSADGCVSR
ncbi:glycoside hydrolase family 131 protein [Parathielavia hyrcaniae]|uniref:Glycoside hydrolase family 131 protein n=1 Tax=Parathielavia hyrcaniae TaxID=113614 RepID=A0AAN6QEE7_9PEZI|nr:glycoside hydrolase family 131 protein [Parathielavia hyrcaniae]